MRLVVEIDHEFDSRELLFKGLLELRQICLLRCTVARNDRRDAEFVKQNAYVVLDLTGDHGIHIRIYDRRDRTLIESAALAEHLANLPLMAADRDTSTRIKAVLDILHEVAEVHVVDVSGFKDNPAIGTFERHDVNAAQGCSDGVVAVVIRLQ